MTTPSRPALVSGQASIILRILAVAAVLAMLIAGFLCTTGLTNDRVATGIIAGAVALICAIIL